MDKIVRREGLLLRIFSVFCALALAISLTPILPAVAYAVEENPEVTLNSDVSPPADDQAAEGDQVVVGDQVAAGDQSVAGDQVVSGESAAASGESVASDQPEASGEAVAASSEAAAASDQPAASGEAAAASEAAVPAENSKASASDASEPANSDNGEKTRGVESGAKGAGTAEPGGTVEGGQNIEEDGTYYLAEGATGTITVGEELTVTIVGAGSLGKFTDLNIVVGNGTTLTIQDVWVSMSSPTGPIIDISGSAALNIEGVNMLENDNKGAETVIDVQADESVVLGGSGTLFGYVGGSAGHAFLGAGASKACGTITFNSGTWCFKVNNRNLTVGGDSGSIKGGTITINGGEIHAKTISMAPGFGSSYQGYGSDVVINDGLVEFYQDYSGLALSGNEGMTLTINGGLVKPVISTNGLYGGGQNGLPEVKPGSESLVVTEVAIGPDSGKHMLVFDTSALDESYFTVAIDDVAYYSGGLYDYVTNEVKSPNKDLTDTDMVSHTELNWLANDESSTLSEAALEAFAYANYPSASGTILAPDTNLYIWMTPEEHTVTINGVGYDYTWDSENGKFVLAGDEPANSYGWYLEPAGENAYEIGTTAELAELANVVNGTVPEEFGIAQDDFAGKTVTLTADVDLSGYEDWTPIGSDYDHAFKGAFDGDGKAITGLTVVGGSDSYQGLFGCNDGVIEDFTIAGSISGTSGDFYGGVAGFNFGTIQDVVSTVDISAAGVYNVGGIAGFNTSGVWVIADSSRNNIVQPTFDDAIGLIQRCGWDGTALTAANKVGGIVGENAGTVSQCFSGAGTIAAPGSSKGGAGGIVGRNGCNNNADETGFVDSCYSLATVGSSGDRWFGGIVGFQNNTYGVSGKDPVSSTRNCYFAGTIVSGYSSNWGPIVGNSDGGSIPAIGSNNYSLEGIASGGSAEIQKGIVKTDAELKDPAMVGLLNGEGSAFNVDSDAINGGYPVLAWQGGTPYVPAPTGYVWYTEATGDAYEIGTAAELAEFANIVNGTVPEEYGIAQDNFAGKTVTLTADIAVAEDGLYTAIENVTYGQSSYPATGTQYVINENAPIWTPIGSGTASSNTGATTDNAFAGTFDGAGHTVSGIYTGSTDATVGNTATVQGLFGVVSGGMVKNVTVSGCITGKIVVGGIVAHLAGGTIENCTNNAIIFADGGTTPNGGTENGLSRGGAVGGIVGNVMDGCEITGCINNGGVYCMNTAKGGRVGGIVGLIDGSAYEASIYNNGNNGDVSGYQLAGGVVGLDYSTVAPIEGCYNAGTVTGFSSGKTSIGGVVAESHSAITSCYNTGEQKVANNADKISQVAGIVGVLGDSAPIANCYNVAPYSGGPNWNPSTGGSHGSICSTGYGTGGVFANCYTLDTLEGDDVQYLNAVSADEMKAAAFVTALNGEGSAFNRDSEGVNSGYPVLAWQGGTPVVSGYEWYTEATGDAYEIATAKDLAEFATIVNGTVPEEFGIAQDDFAGKTVTLTADVDISAYTNWTPIGGNGKAFAGTFDGNDKAVEGLSFTTGGGYKGLFGNNAGTVKDFTISGSIGSEGTYVGGNDFYGVVALNTGTVSGIVSSLSIYPGTGDTYAVGGVVGKNQGGTVSQCGFTGIISSDTSKSIYRTGGVVGFQSAGSISECFNTATVIAWNYRNGDQGTGGILGSMEDGTVSYCYNTANVYNGDGSSSAGGKQGAGGIVGAISAGSVDHCYSTGSAYGPGSAGVIIGKLGNGTYSDLYSLYTARSWQQYGTQTDPESGLKFCDGSDENADGSLKFGGAALANSYNSGYTIVNSWTKQADEMKADAFCIALNGEGSAFNMDSDGINGGYPVLAWQGGTEPVAPFELTVGESPVFLPGATAEFTVTATGVQPGETVSYQWYYSKGDGKFYKSSFEGATSDTLVTTCKEGYETREYRCTATTSEGRTATSQAQGYASAPDFAVTPGDQPLYIQNAEAAFTVNVTGTAVGETIESYQWYYSTNGTTFNKTSFPGADTDTLITTCRSGYENRTFKCTVTTSAGRTATSEPQGYDKSAVLEVASGEAPTFVEGETADFTVEVSGLLPGETASYQWYYSKDGGTTFYKTSFAGATTDTLTTSCKAGYDTREYRCNVTTSEGRTAVGEAQAYANVEAA